MTASLPAHTALLVADLLEFIAQGGCTDDEFDAMAARLFAHQVAHNGAYRRFCQRRGITPRRVSRWQDIPAVPIGAFKEATLSCEPTEACERVFMTSGTTRAELVGRHWHPTMAVWDASMLRNFARRFMAGEDSRIPMAVLFPPESELANSSLARYLSQAVRHFGSAGSAWFVTTAGMDTPGLLARLRQAERSGEAFAVLGASYSFVHLLDTLAASGERLRLPAGSRILDTGGMKGRSREVPPAQFYEALADRLGVPRERCINMYGMTELSTQFYDAGNAVLPSVKSGPHWIRSRVVDPLSGAQLPAGTRGILVHCDLASFNSATTILTEDVGVAVEGGFHLLGRAEGAQAKGCSLAAEEFLQASTP
ncbi:long-chain fatty acid--CoA ligase [Ramlibacter sp. AN1015]|uniref:LuxE/PaaK family acyltransferase n=1 Tax=Ramlibacter sp. AN1015 TaxID=3133428 RepID=UPI0030C46793